MSCMDDKIHVEDFDFIGIDCLKLCEMSLSEVNQMITTRITVDSKEVGAYDQRTIEQRVSKNEQALRAQADWRDVWFFRYVRWLQMNEMLLSEVK